MSEVKSTETTSAIDAIEVGSIWAGKYIIDEELGADREYGRSFLARHKYLKRKVYLKILKSVVGGQRASDEPDPLFKEMSRASDASGNIETVFDSGIYNGLSYIEIQWFDGDYFKNLDEARVRREAVKDWSDFFLYMSIIAKALSRAHHYDIYHKNLMWRYLFKKDVSGEPVLAGFGHTARLSENPNEASLGLSAGAVGYLSPQHVSGLYRPDGDSLEVEDRIDIDSQLVTTERRQEFVKGDIWAFGATMYHLITGQTIHAEDTLEGAEKSLAKGVNLSLLESKVEGQFLDDIRVFLQECLQVGGGYQSMADLVPVLERLEGQAKGLSEDLKFWPTKGKHWFKDDREHTIPKHTFDYNDKRSKEETRNYLRSLSVLMYKFFDDWWECPQFYAALKGFVGYHALCHNIDNPAAEKVPTYASIILIFASTINSPEDLLLLQSLDNKIWRSLNENTIFDLKIETSNGSGSPEKLDENKETLASALMLFHDLFKSLSVLEGLKEGGSAIEGVSFDRLDQGELSFQLKFYSQKLLDGVSGSDGLDEAIDPPGTVTKNILDLNDYLSRWKTPAVFIALEGSADKGTSQLIIRNVSKVRKVPVFE